MSLRDRAEVTERGFFSEDDSRWTVVDGRRSADGGRRTAVGEVSLFISLSLSSLPEMCLFLILQLF